VRKRTKQAIVIGALAAALAVGAGAAVAGGGLWFGNDQQAFLNDAAKRLDVPPAELKAALQGAYGDRLDAAVAAGKITKEQADAMKQRSTQGGLPFFGGGDHHGGFGHHGPPSLAAAATYLGLTEAELRAELQAGKTLAQVAKAQGKSVDGLQKALAAEMKTKLDAAVAAGKLTRAQADELQARMTEHLDDLVNGNSGPDGHHRGHGPDWDGPPPSGSQPPSAFVPVAPTGSSL
jgi:hypothetical protein